MNHWYFRTLGKTLPGKRRGTGVHPLCVSGLTIFSVWLILTRRIRISMESVLQAPAHSKASTLSANGSEFPAFKLASLWVLNSPEIRITEATLHTPKRQASLKTHRALELESKNCCRLGFLHPQECPPESSLSPPGQIPYSPFLLSRNSVLIW